jgi:hypothetical protein
MKLLSFLQFFTLFIAFCFITFVNLSIAWVLIFLVVAFAYFVAIKHYLRKDIEKEYNLLKNEVK